ncbi:member of the karyopherin-beta [Oleoguttula sp. CCFEE 5521]
MAVAPPQSVAEVATLVKRLYQPGNAAIIVQIQEQLQVLQRSGEGWQLADALLGDNDINVRFFGALTFTVKLNNDGLLLEDTTSQYILQRLVSWFVRLVNAMDKPLVIRKLCSTLVTFFTRVPSAWKRPLLHLIYAFRVDPETLVDVEAITTPTEELLQSLSTHQYVALLWFTASLADEMTKMEYSGPKHASLHVQMEGEVGDSVALMRHAMLEQSNGPSEGLHCFSTWATYAQPMWPGKPDALASLQGLLPDAMNLLMSESHEADALTVFVDLLESYTSFFDAQNLDRLSQFLGEVEGPRLHAHLADEGASHHAAGPFVIAYGIAVVEDIIKRPNHPRSQVTMPLLLAMPKASGYPGDDDELSGLSIEFWNTYTETLTDLCFSEDDLSGSSTPWVAHARQVAFEIVDLLLKKLWTPPGSITKDWGDSEREGFATFRADTTDLFSSMYVFLREDMLTRFVNFAVAALRESSWRALEASMFALNAIADNVLEDQTSDKHLAALFQSGGLYREMGDFTQKIPVQVRKTAIDMIGNYGAYMERHAESLPDAIRFLFASLGTASLSTASAKSIASLCSTCRHSLTGELDGFLSQYRDYLGSPTCEPYGKEKVIGAIAAITQALSPESAKVRPLAAMLDNVEQDIAFARQQMLVSGDHELGQVTGVAALQCLASIGRALQVPDDVPINLYDDDETPASQQNFWQTSEEGQSIQQRIIGCFSILEVLGSDGEVVDAACEVIRTGFTETVPGPFVLPPSVTVSFLQQCTISTPQVEAVLHTADLLIVQHSRSDSIRIPSEVTAVLNHTVGLLLSLGQPSTDPGIAQSGVDVLVRLFPAYISVLLSASEETLTQVLNFTLQAIKAQDPLPKRSALEFWSRLLRTAGPPASTDEAAMCSRIVNAFGESFAASLVRQMTGQANRSELDYVSAPLRVLVSLHGTQAKQWLEAALWPVAQPDEVKSRFLLQIMGLRGGAKTRDVVREFWIGCRGL